MGVGGEGDEFYGVEGASFVLYALLLAGVRRRQKARQGYAVLISHTSLLRICFSLQHMPCNIWPGAPCHTPPRRYVTHVNDKLGPLQRLIPPTPPLTRYKKVGGGASVSSSRFGVAVAAVRVRP